MKKNEASKCNHGGTKRTPKPMEKTHSMDTKMQQRIYLGHPCRGRLYHLIMTLLKKQRRFCVALWWDRSYGKVKKSTICKMQGGENLTYMQMSKNEFYHGMI
jgi:hypothetical protein